MTLCVAWKGADTIKFATDSRTQLDAGESDCVTKLFRLPFCIRSASSGNIIAKGDLGVAVAGFGLCSLIIKDAISELLPSISTNNHPDKYDMLAVANLFYAVFDKIMASMSSVTAHHLSHEIVFAGLCAKLKSHRAFSLRFEQRKPSLCELFASGHAPKIFGSGAAPAALLINGSNNESVILNAVQNVIDDPQFDDVGGSIQYGAFDGPRVILAVAAKTGAAAPRKRALIDLDGHEFAQEGFASAFPLHPF